MKLPTFSLIALLFLLAIAPSAPAAASNKGETTEASGSSVAAPEEAGSGSAAEMTDEGGGEEAAPGSGNPPAEVVESSGQSDSGAGEEDGQDKSAAEEAPRPELPSLDEGAELHTVREDPPEQEIPSAGKELSAATLAMLKALETRHASIVTVHGEFDQLKVSEIFLEEIKSRGTFRFKKPDLFRCDYEPPDEMTNLIRKDAIYIYVPELEQCEVYRFASDQERDQQLHSMVLGFGFRTSELLEAYEIRSSEDPGTLREELVLKNLNPDETVLFELTPRPEVADTSPFTQLKLWIDKEQLLPEKVWFEDYNGDQTTLDIRRIELNPSLDPKLFDASFPSGTEFIDKTES
jgi:outer membrane lipoprotein-sorting protein